MTLLRSPTGDGGFTLLELLVTMTVASLLVAVAAPRMVDAVGHARLKASAVRASVALREARMQARRREETARVTIDPAGKGYAVGNRAYPMPTGLTVIFKPYSEQAETEKNVIRFLPDGSSSGGTLTVAHGGDRVTVEIDWLTGRVTVGD
jgi:general secretion pathway protein H